MEQLLQQVQRQGQDWGYSWLPLTAVEAVVWLLAGTILRPAGKMKQALAYFGRAQDAIDSELARQKLGLQVAIDALSRPHAVLRSSCPDTPVCCLYADADRTLEESSCLELPLDRVIIAEGPSIN